VRRDRAPEEGRMTNIEARIRELNAFKKVIQQFQREHKEETRDFHRGMTNVVRLLGMRKNEWRTALAYARAHTPPRSLAQARRRPSAAGKAK